MWLLTACLAACTGALLPEVPRTPRSASPAPGVSVNWQAETAQIQEASTPFGTLTFTPFTFSTDPSRVRFTFTAAPAGTGQPDPGLRASGTLDLVSQDGRKTRLTLTGTGAAFEAETRVTSGQNTTLTAMITIDGIPFSVRFDFRASPDSGLDAFMGSP